MTLCKPTDFWGACARRVKDAIEATDDPRVALEAGAEWAMRYEGLYKANPRPTWTPDDQDRLKDAMQGLWDDHVGKYLDPASLAYDLALKRFFPSLAAALEWAGSPYILVFQALLAPSPIANDFTAAGPDNEEINRLVRSKLPVPAAATIANSYPELFRQSFERVKGPDVLP